MKACKLAALAASIALAVGSTAVMAQTAPPAAGQLPGQGKVVSGTAPTVTEPSSGNATLTIGLSGNTVIDWGAASGATIMKDSTTPGFNIGKGATVDFGGSGAVLNVDTTGNPSQIFGALNGGSNSVFVANSNGIIVGASATISAGSVALIANNLSSSGSWSDFDGTGGTLTFDATGGDVTVAKGSSITGSFIVISGGGSVNVDLSGLTTSNEALIGAGRSLNETPVTWNSGASLAVSGEETNMGSATVKLVSGGDATNAGTLGFDNSGPFGQDLLTVQGDFTNAAGAEVDLTDAGGISVGGSFSNAGTLAFNAATALLADVVNTQTGSITASADATFGSLDNGGIVDLGGHSLTLANGDLTNSTILKDIGAITVAKGGLNNSGVLTATGGVSVTGGDLSNAGSFTAGGAVSVTGGNFANASTSQLEGASLTVTDGHVDNAGMLTVDSGALTTTSDADATAGASYYVTNTGTITGGATGLDISVNTGGSANVDSHGDPLATMGSFRNSGTLQVGPNASDLTIEANNGIILGGTLQVNTGTKWVTPSGARGDTSSLGDVTLTGSGMVKAMTPIISNGGVQLTGNQTWVMDDIAGPNAGASAGVWLLAGDKPADFSASNPDDYMVRIANGVTVNGANVSVQGTTSTVGGTTVTAEPNLILQGTLAGGTVNFQGSDIYGGPNGSILADTADFNFSGLLKTAPYLNDGNNFRYNYLLISPYSSDTVTLGLNPTSTVGSVPGGSAVNILVNGNIALQSHATDPTGGVLPSGTIPGTTNNVNTHLVLQSTGKITTLGNFYWPGLVYLGNITADSDGNPLPGTLGLGQIELGGSFSNLLKGDIAGRDGIHFITQWPLLVSTGSSVTTNAVAFINFGSQALAQAYGEGIFGTGITFQGGATTTTGKVTTVTYDAVGSAALKGGNNATTFHAAPPVSKQ